MDRRRRQRCIAEILGKGQSASGGVQSQEELRELLAHGGFRVTQGTLSRDLRTLGVVKGAGGYILPGGTGPSPREAVEARLTLTGEIEAAVRQHLLSGDVAGTLVVLRTYPGHAGAVAAALDRFPPKGVVGTVAGDDTIFIAVRTPLAAKRLATYLRSLAGLS